jgi:hypothetical protein
MKNIKLNLFLIAIVALAMGSCKKDKTVSELLTTGSWKFTVITIDPGIDLDGSGSLVTDLFAQLDACDKDDLTIFKSGGISNYDEGAVKCDSSSPQTTTGTWVLSADEKTLTFDGESWQILSLDDSTLKVKYAEDYGSGVTYTITATLSH